MVRHDLTNWIIHFVHRRNPENDPLEFYSDFEEFGYTPHPDGFSFEGSPIFLTNKYEEDSYSLAPDDYAISVLQKILHDGYIRAGWSYRKGRPTIYGPKAAVCFTEMPLYGLIEYAKRRNNENLTQQYGIAFLKDELFVAGARPVIYGLSAKHEEAQESDPNYGIGLRNLSAETGVGLKEQYRYVYTNLNSYKRTDWTHEREWRWADLHQEFDFPGIPVYADNDRIKFSKIIIIVKTSEEAEEIIDQLKNLFHSRMNDFGRGYQLDLIANSYVVALEELNNFSDNIDLVKLDDLPLHTLPKMKKVTVPKATLEKVKKAIDNASEINFNASKAFHDKNGDRGPSGFSHVTTWDSNSEITQALIDLELAKSFADGYYHIYGLKLFSGQSIDLEEAGAKAAAEYLTQELGQTFSYSSRLD